MPSPVSGSHGDCETNPESTKAGLQQYRKNLAMAWRWGKDIDRRSSSLEAFDCERRTWSVLASGANLALKRFQSRLAVKKGGGHSSGCCMVKTAS